MLSTISALNPWIVAVGFNTILAAIGLVLPKRLLTTAGLVHAWILGIILWGSLGWRGYFVVLVYFFAGSAVTRLGMKQKQAAGIAEKRAGARGPENVWGSAFAGAICALSVAFLPPTADFWRSLLLLGYMASFCTKLSDTTASEVGKVYGKRTFLMTSLSPVPPGTEGAVSVEGTVAGAVASVVLAVFGWTVELIDPVGIVICVIAAFIGTSLESVIGATLQPKYVWMTNEVVNAINTVLGASAAILIALAIQGFR